MNIDQIIGKMMGDGSIGDEKSAIDSWKKEAEENIKALEDIRKISVLSDSLKDYQDFNEEGAWSTFQNTLSLTNSEEQAIKTKTQEIQINAKTNEDKKIFSLRNIIKVAAVAVILLGALFVFNNQKVDAGFEGQNYSSLDKSLDVNLVDGTSVVLDFGSKMRSKDERTVSIKGRAFFDVARDESQQFKINLPVGEITVLGTEFTVVADDKRTEIFVKEGSVAYKFQGATYTLVAGEFIQVVDNNVEKFQMKDGNYNSWKNKRLLFNDNTMSEVVEALSRHFGKSVELNNPKLFKNCNVKATFDDSSLEQILNEFSTTHGLKYEVRNDIYLVSASDC
ncbi:MAG: transmembrane sensor [Saprospiraceae bacterium]|jgi:transmembrane sensor